MIICLNNCYNTPINSKLPTIHPSSYYKTKNDSVYFSEFSNDSNMIDKCDGIIFHDSQGNTIQKIINFEKIKKEDYSKVINELIQKRFRNKLEEGENVIFIQLRPEKRSSFEVLDLRHKIEDEIDSCYYDKNIGSWFAGDDGNMLYEIYNWENAIEIATNILHKRGLRNQFIIAKRIKLSTDNWNYHIVYPRNYEGKFNQM